MVGGGLLRGLNIRLSSMVGGGGGFLRGLYIRLSSMAGGDFLEGCT